MKQRVRWVESEAKSGWSQEREFFGSAEPPRKLPVIARGPFTLLRIHSVKFRVVFVHLVNLPVFILLLQLYTDYLPCSALSGAGRGRAANVFPDCNHEPSKPPRRKPPEFTPTTFQQIIAHRGKPSTMRLYAGCSTRSHSGRSFRTSAAQPPSGKVWFRINT